MVIVYLLNKVCGRHHTSSTAKGRKMLSTDSNILPALCCQGRKQPRHSAHHSGPSQAKKKYHLNSWNGLECIASSELVWNLALIGTVVTAGKYSAWKCLMCDFVKLPNTGEPWMNIKSGRVIVDGWTASAITAEGGPVCVIVSVLYTLAVEHVKKRRERPFKMKMILCW